MAKQTVRQTCKTMTNSRDNDDVLTVDAAFGETNVTEERQDMLITR
jgi:hypothetical protein